MIRATFGWDLVKPNFENYPTTRLPVGKLLATAFWCRNTNSSTILLFLRLLRLALYLPLLLRLSGPVWPLLLVMLVSLALVPPVFLGVDGGWNVVGLVLGCHRFFAGFVPRPLAIKTQALNLTSCKLYSLALNRSAHIVSQKSMFSHHQCHGVWKLHTGWRALGVLI